MSYTFTKSKINPEALEQSEFWFDRTGREHVITNMSSWHAVGAMRKLFGAFGVGCMNTPLYEALQRQATRR